MENSCTLTPYSKGNLKELIDSLLVSYYDLDENKKKEFIQNFHKNILDAALKLNMEVNESAKQDINEIFKDIRNEYEEELKEDDSLTEDDIKKELETLNSDLKVVEMNLVNTLEVPVSQEPTKVPQPESKNTTDQDNKPIKKQRTKVRKILKDIFGSSIGPKQYRQLVFSLDVFGFICAGKTLITNNKELNKAIAALKNNYYNDILNYLKDLGYDIKEFPPTLYDSKLKLNRGYELILRVYEEDILPGMTKDQIRFGWAAALKGENNNKSLAFNVLNSYINLRYFDSLLREKVGKVIGIDKDVEDNVEVDVSLNKYSFRTVINDLSKGWETLENLDALETTSRFSKMIIENIPMLNYNNPEAKLNYNVTTTTFAGAFCNLFNSLINSNNSGGTESTQVAITDYLFYMHKNPKKYVKEILYKLFEGKGRDGLRKELLLNGLTEFDLNVLYSSYLFLFNKKTGLEKVERNYMTSSDNDTAILPNLYPLIECVTGVVDRLMGINYLQYDLNNSGEMEISFKPKFRAKRKMYDLINKVNRGIILRQDVDRLKLQDKYKFKRIDQKTWEFKVGELSYLIQATSDTLFTNKDATIKQVVLDENNEYKLIDIDFSKLLKSFENISDNPQLKLFLDFILDNLPGIRFLSDLDIEKLISAGNLSKTLLKEMFMSAARSGTVNKIHIDYINSKSDLVFSEWASENFFELAGTLDKKIWTKSLGDLDLLVLYPYNTWIEHYVTGEAIIDGSVGLSTIKDMDGNSIGNFSTSFLGGNIFYYLKQSVDWRSDEDPNILSTHGKLLFSRDSKLITGVVVNLDSRNQERTERKLAKSMNIGELAEQSIFHNFFESYYGENEKTKGAYFILPTTFSDKTKFVQYKVDANTEIEFGVERLYYGKKISELGQEAMIQLYYDTVGEFYRQEFNNTVTKLKKVFGIPNENYQGVLNAIEKLNTDTRYKTKEEREQALINLAESKGITLFLDSDYIINGGKIQFNPLLDYYNNYLFANIDNLKKKFNEEKLNFLNDIIASNDIFYTKRLNGENTSIGEVILKIFSINKEDMKNETLYGFVDKDNKDSAVLQYNALWVKKDEGRYNDKLILAKQLDESGNVIAEFIYGEDIPKNANIILNPIFEHYFLTEATLSSNLRLSLTGSEIAHPIKWDNPSEVPNPMDRFSPGYYENGMFSRLETLTQGAQLKRNVIIPATLLYFLLNTLRGVPDTLKIATIRDLKAPVFNFIGDSKMQDTSDGGGYSNSLITIIENYSLQDLRVGTVKKTIAHSPNYATGGSFLGKWAIFGITAETMRNSLNGDISLYEIDKKLLNLQWYLEDGSLNSMIDKKIIGNNVIDITEIISSRNKKHVNTEDTFGLEILKGRRLFYRNPETNNIREIVSIGRDKDTGIYYTEEYDISRGKQINKDPERVYHLFSDSDSTHLTLSAKEFESFKGNVQKKSINHYTIDIDGISDWHTINSNFELKETLGGIYSVLYSKETKSWEYSDTSSYATCEFLNLVAFRRDKSARREFDQDDFYQPLKHAMIHYAVNNTAVKNGAGNINQSDAWRNKSPLTYMKVLYDGIGVLMDADHTADEALLTEFSQVISSLDALGNLHEHAKNIFESLLKIARSASITEIEVLDNFIKNIKGHQDKRIQLLSGIYDVVGRSIINNFKSNNEASLAEDVINLVKKHFDLSLQHSLDLYKIPFSDPGIFQGIIPVFASLINNKSVKRKYPGSGYVMCPGYNSRLIFLIDGFNYLFNDIVDLVKSFIKINKIPALAELYKRGKHESYVDWERRIVKEYLKYKQSALIKESRKNHNTGRDLFIPTDNAYVVVKDLEGNEMPPIRISLHSIEDYVTFTSGYWWKLLFDKNTEGHLTGDKDNYDLENAEFFQDIERGRDLAPSRITWKDSKGKQHNIFELDEVRKGFTAKLSFYDAEFDLVISVNVPSNYIKKKAFELEYFIKYTLGYKGVSQIKIERNRLNRAAVLKIFNDLSEGRFTRNGSSKPEQAFDILNKPSLVILSNMHKSKFPNKSLPYILRNHKNVFNEDIVENISGSEKYEFTLVNPNNKHQYITFSEIKVLKKVSGNRELVYKYKKYILETIPEYVDENGKKVKKKDVIMIYNIDKDTSILQYPIGVLEEVKNPSKKIYHNEAKLILKSGYIKIGDKIYKEEYFILRYSVPHIFEVDSDIEGEKTKKEVSQVVYYINRELINKYYGNYRKAGEIISKIYEIGGAKELRLNIDKVDSIEKSKLIQDMLSSVKMLIDIEQKLVDSTRYILDKLNLGFEQKLTPELKKELIETIKDEQYSNMEKYYTARSKYRYTSFLRSLEVIMSRIPAQSLLSFMKGEVVGFLNTSETHAYVSHWLLYLQGSDYDIDKSYIMAASFNDDGLYYSWSPLFDFFSINTLRASEINIPLSTPGKSINFVSNPDKAVDITDLVKNIELNTKDENLRIRNIEIYGKILQIIENDKKHKGVNLYINNTVVNQTIIDTVKKNLIKHIQYVPTETVRENAIKNLIQSGIGHVVLHLKNMIHAYSPITMDELRQDPRNARIMSLMNPMTKYVMLVLNMIGKDVIGISAVGEKVFFTLTYYWNEQLRNGLIENLKFRKVFTRILNRKEDAKLNKLINEILDKYRTLIDQLPDVYDVSEMNQEELEGFNKAEGDDDREIVYSKVKSRKTEELNRLAQIQLKVLRRREGGLKTQPIDRLANVNFSFDGIQEMTDSFDIVRSVHDLIVSEGLLEVGSDEYTKEMLERLRVIQDNSNKADLFISLLLSAATDNAKELILAQINAGSDLAGIYMYLISLGFDIKDVVAFMTSPAMLTVHKLMQSNMFDLRSLNLSLNDLIKVLSGDVYKVDRNIKFDTPDSFRKYIQSVLRGDEILTGNDRFKLVIKTIINSLEGLDISEFFKDVEELKNIIPGSLEHTNLGGIFLKLNQGLPTSQEDLLTKLLRISNLVLDRIKIILDPAKFKDELKKKEDIELSWENIKSGKVTKDQISKSDTFAKLVENILSNNPKLDRKIVIDTLLSSMFDSYTNLKDEEVPPLFFEFNVRQWIQDGKYKYDLINLYNLIKDTWNIFDVVDKVPLYKELLKLLKLVYTCNDELVLKSRTLNLIHQKLLKKKEFMDEYSYLKLMEYVDDRIIYTFLTNELPNYNFSIPPDFGYLNSERLILQNDDEKLIRFNNIDGIANFKRFFEEYFIKNLNNPDFDATELIGVLSVADNDFIRNLVIDIDSKSGIPFFKLDINMMQIETGAEALTLYETMVNGLEELEKIKYQGHSLVEWFMLYNLIVNKNKYGEDRLTTIFKSYIDSNRYSEAANLYNRYYNFIGKIDHEYHDSLEEVLGINYNDILLYMAPVVPEYLEKYSKSKYIMQYVDGIPIYKFRARSRDNYREISTGVSKTIITTRSQLELKEITRNSTLYYLREAPNLDNIQYFKDILRGGEVDLIMKALQLLESNEIVLFKINC